MNIYLVSYDYVIIKYVYIASDNKVWLYLQSSAVCGNSTMPLNRNGLNIVDVDVKDVRFPTSLGGHGSDALVRHTNSYCYESGSII